MTKRFQVKNPENSRKIHDIGDSSKPQIIRTIKLRGICSKCSKPNATAVRIRGNPGQAFTASAKAPCGNCSKPVDLSLTTVLG